MSPETRRLPGVALGLLAVATTACAIAACGGNRTPRERPDVVLVIADDMDNEHLGFLGSELARTPTLDRLAEAGTVFSTAHVPVARCRPSLATLLSGRWPHQSGISSNRGDVTLDPTGSLPNLLRAAGYATFLSGKYWEGDLDEMGFEASAPGEGFAREGQAALFDFVDENAGGRPLFVWWAPQMPHMPHDPPARFRELFDVHEIPAPAWFERPEWSSFGRTERAYAECLVLAMGAWFDACLDELCEKLAAAGRIENTLFVFLIDNGAANGLTSKGSPFEKGLRTPIVFSWPGRIPGGERIPRLVSTVDVFPTILDYAGVEVPAGAAGVSLRPLIEGEDVALDDVLYGAAYPREARAGSAGPSDEAYAFYARTPRWKYIVYRERLTAAKNAAYRIQSDYAPPLIRERGDEDLFDLERDPHELDDLAGPDRRERMDELRAGLVAWWERTGGGELRLPPPR